MVERYDYTSESNLREGIVGTDISANPPYNTPGWRMTRDSQGKTMFCPIVMVDGLHNPPHILSIEEGGKLYRNHVDAIDAAHSFLYPRKPLAIRIKRALANTLRAIAKRISPND